MARAGTLILNHLTESFQFDPPLPSISGNPPGVPACYVTRDTGSMAPGTFPSRALRRPCQHCK